MDATSDTISPHNMGPYTQPHENSTATDKNFCKGYHFKPASERNKLTIKSLRDRGLTLSNPLSRLGFAQGYLANAIVKETNRHIVSILKERWRHERTKIKQANKTTKEQELLQGKYADS